MVALAQPRPPQRKRFRSMNGKGIHKERRPWCHKEVHELGEGIPLPDRHLPDILEKATEDPAQHFRAFQEAQHGHSEPGLRLVIGLG